MRRRRRDEPVPITGRTFVGGQAFVQHERGGPWYDAVTVPPPVVVLTTPEQVAAAERAAREHFTALSSLRGYELPDSLAAAWWPATADTPE